MTSKMRLYTQQLYDAMIERSTIENENMQVFTGFIHKLYISLDGVVPGYYSPVVKKLIQLGCIERVEKGYRATPSKYILHYPPEAAEWSDAPADSPLTRAGEHARLLARLESVEGRLASRVEPAIRSLDERVVTLEKSSNVKIS